MGIDKFYWWVCCFLVCYETLGDFTYSGWAMSIGVEASGVGHDEPWSSISGRDSFFLISPRFIIKSL